MLLLVGRLFISPITPAVLLRPGPRAQRDGVGGRVAPPAHQLGGGADAAGGSRRLSSPRRNRQARHDQVLHLCPQAHFGVVEQTAGGDTGDSSSPPPPFVSIPVLCVLLRRWRPGYVLHRSIASRENTVVFVNILFNLIKTVRGLLSRSKSSQHRS